MIRQQKRSAWKTASRLLAALVAMVFVGNFVGDATANQINPGQDFWRTPAGGAVLNVPGFGNQDFVGLPTGPGLTDTIITRTGTIPSGSIGPILAEITELSLISVTPINFDTGTGSKPHDIFVNLDPTMTSSGTVTIDTHTDAAGPDDGTFSSSFTVHANATIRAKDGTGTPMVITGITDTISSAGANWQHLPTPDHPAPGLTGGFFPGPVVHTGPHPTTLPGCIDCGPGITVPGPDHHNFPIALADSFAIGPTIWPGIPTELGPIDLVIRPIFPPPWHRPIFPPRFIERVPPFDILYEFASEMAGLAEIVGPNGEILGEVELKLEGPTQTLVRDFDNPNRRQTGSFDTEMLSMSLSGMANIGGNDVEILIRENPELGSTGRNNVAAFPGTQGNFHVDSFFDVFTEISLDGGANWTRAAERTQVVLNPPAPGDTNKDDLVRIEDIQQSIANFTGPTNNPGNLSQDTISGKNRRQGDVQGDVGNPHGGDGDVDIKDFQVQIANFNVTRTAAAAAGDFAGAVTDLGDPGTADLVYNFLTGEVSLDPAESVGGELTSFVLETSGAFNAPSIAMFPGHGLMTDLAGEISWTDPFSGETVPINLGAIFPTGLSTVAALGAFLDTANYTGSLGSGGPYDFELFVVPEPSSWILLATMSLLLLTRVRRTSCLGRR